MISGADIQKVREATDIVSVFNDYAPVQSRGRDYWCCCPLHQEKTPSCKIDSSSGLWHCFGCGEGGDVFTFIMKIQDLSFYEAVYYLADKAHIEIEEQSGAGSVSRSKKARLKAVCEATAAFYHQQLMRNPDPEVGRAREYLAKRSFGGSVPKKWNLGYAPGGDALVHHLKANGFTNEELIEANVAFTQHGRIVDRFFNRIMFPINDAQGECIAFGGRVVGTGEPKYLNSQETPIFHKSSVLFGLDKAKAAMTATGMAVVVEGYTDVIALHEAGINQTVATLGTALTASHIRLLARHAQRRIIYLFDGDEAGQRAADRALGFIDNSMTPEAGRTRIDLCAVTLPDNLDPAEFVEAHGADALKKLFEEAKPLLKYGIDRRLASFDTSSAEGRMRALASVLEILAPIKDSLLAKEYAIQIASRLRLREQDVWDALAKIKPPRRYQEDKTAKRTSPSQTGQPARGLNEHQQEVEPTSSEAEQMGAVSQLEHNRLQFEREFLCLLAQNPALALNHADRLAQTQWHNALHEKIAHSLLDTLAQDSTASAATLITEASRVSASAAGVLTSNLARSGVAAADLATYLSEELAIGDTEETIASLKLSLSDPSNFSKSDYEALFEAIITMQKNLTEKRRAHKPLYD